LGKSKDVSPGFLISGNMSNRFSQAAWHHQAPMSAATQDHEFDEAQDLFFESVAKPISQKVKPES
jgi:hypothetical protein